MYCRKSGEVLRGKWLRRVESLKREALNREDNGSAFVRQPPDYGVIGYADVTDMMQATGVDGCRIETIRLANER